MADEQKTKWTLELDSEQAFEAFKHLNEAKEKVGDSDSLNSLISTITSMGPIIGGVAAAIFVIKESMDLVFDAEKIKAVNQQFEVLSKNAGLFGSKLKEALEVSAGGLVDEVALLKGAGVAITELGDNAQKLPQIMTVARQATALFGGDLMTNFNEITRAIASGNTRMLRHLGIVIDQKKAYQDYAKSIGVASDELSLAGRQQAVLNAVLEKGAGGLAGISDQITPITNEWTKLKVGLTEFKDEFVLVFDKVMGPLIRNALVGLNDIGKQIKFMYTVSKNLFNAITGGHAEVSEAASKSADSQIASSGKVATASKIDIEKRLQNQQKFEQERLKLEGETLTRSIESARTIAQVNDSYEKMKVNIHAQAANQIAMIDAKAGLSHKQKAAQRVLIEQDANFKIKQLDEKLWADREKADAKYLKDSQNTFQGVARAAEVASHKATHDLQDFGKQGDMIFGEFKTAAVSSLEGFTSSSDSATDQVKHMFFGMIGGVAEQYGEMLLLAGIGSFNPAEAAAGAALLVLGGFLKSQAGSSSAGSSVSAPSASSSISNGSIPSDTSTAAANLGSSGPSPTVANQSHKSVNITVEGNYFDTETARLAMVQLIRNASDATDFNIKQVGG